ncbi:hypothetical protein [Rhodococcoides fascians]|uniref:hypothetical protein n=1 Tax=Rhodococcoides fascians TaxID=1828 RepID=UPI00056D9387|nr:hypothetical protein [Rhodococcus fascians]
MITIITARGVSEAIGRNMITAVTRGLDPTRFRVRELEAFSASYGWVGGNEAFGVSQERGRAALLRMIDEDPYPVILVGFSAGAKLVGDVAAEIASGMHPRLHVLLVGVIADPARHHTQFVGEDRGGYGITGGRWIDPKDFPVYSYTAPGDPISELPEGNPLRSLADLTEYWGPDIDRWLRELVKVATARQWQRWWDLRSWRTWSGAIFWANNYLHGGRHIKYAVENMPGSNVTYTKHLHNVIAELGRKR